MQFTRERYREERKGRRALKEDRGAQRSTEMKFEDERDHSKDGGGSKPKTKTKTGKEKEHVEVVSAY